MEAIIFVGMPGCGKSTFFKEYCADTHVRLNLDMLSTRHREKILFEACLAAKQPFVVDNTNPSVADRERYLPKAKAAHFRTIACWFDVSFGTCVERNADRHRFKRVPAVAMNAMRKKFVPPTLDEGFDEVRRVILSDNGTPYVVV